jgi:hypothetical protein
MTTRIATVSATPSEFLVTLTLNTDGTRQPAL